MSVQFRKTQLIDLLRQPANIYNNGGGVDRSRLEKRKHQLASYDQEQATNAQNAQNIPSTTFSLLSIINTNNSIGLTYFNSIDKSITFCQQNLVRKYKIENKEKIF